MKRLCPLLFVLCCVAPHAQAQEKKKTTEPPPEKAANGLQIQSYDTRTLRDDMAEMLGIWLWKFRLTALKKGTVGVRLELRTPGEPPKSLGGFGSFEPPKSAAGLQESSKGDYVFGIQPLGDDSLYIDTAPKIRLYMRSSSYWAGGELKGPGNSHVIDNPFRNLGSPSFPYAPLLRADGSLLLVQFSPSGKDDDPKNSALVVATSLQSPPPGEK